MKKTLEKIIKKIENRLWLWVTKRKKDDEYVELNTVGRIKKK